MIERRMSETGNRRAPLQCRVCACEIMALRMEWAVGEERSRLSAGDPVDRGGGGLGGWRRGWAPNRPGMGPPAHQILVSRRTRPLAGRVASIDFLGRSLLAPEPGIFV